MTFDAWTKNLKQLFGPSFARRAWLSGDETKANMCVYISI